jgi:hypothetical protein
VGIKIAEIIEKVCHLEGVTVDGDDIYMNCDAVNNNLCLLMLVKMIKNGDIEINLSGDYCVSDFEKLKKYMGVK